MAERGLGRARLEEIREGLREVKEMIRDRAERGNLRGLIRDLKRIPAGDREKKRELAAFFQTEEGDRYSREERHQAYIDLLGERNHRQRG